MNINHFFPLFAFSFYALFSPQLSCRSRKKAEIFLTFFKWQHFLDRPNIFFLLACPCPHIFHTLTHTHDHHHQKTTFDFSNALNSHSLISIICARPIMQSSEKRQALIPFPRTGKRSSSSSSSLARWPTSKDVLNGKRSSLIMFPRTGKRSALIPFPRTGKKSNLIPFPRTGKRSGLISFPRTGKKSLEFQDYLQDLEDEDEEEERRVRVNKLIQEDENGLTKKTSDVLRKKKKVESSRS